MYNYVLFNTFVHFIIQKLKNKHTFLKTEKAKFSWWENLVFMLFWGNWVFFQFFNYKIHNYVLFAIIVHFNIQKPKNKQTFIQTEKAKSSHFDRTRGDKNQIFPTYVYSQNTKSFWYINFGTNIYLLLYPSLGNSITHITSFCSVGLLGLSWILLRAFGSGRIFFGKSAAGELDLSELDFPDFLGDLSYL